MRVVGDWEILLKAKSTISVRRFGNKWLSLKAKIKYFYMYTPGKENILFFKSFEPHDGAHP